MFYFQYYVTIYTTKVFIQVPKLVPILSGTLLFLCLFFKERTLYVPYTRHLKIATSAVFYKLGPTFSHIRYELILQM